MANLVVFEPGYAAFAGMRVPVADAGTRGEIQIGGQAGCVIRPLLYGERSRAVLRYAASGDSVASVSAAILHMALVQPGNTETTVAEILALALAGAEQDAPPFSAVALSVARASGWDIRQIDQAEASAVDRLAIHIGGPLAESADDGWTRLVLVHEPCIDTLADVRRALAERLLKRADAQPVANVLPDADTHAATEPSVPGSPKDHLESWPHQAEQPLAAPATENSVPAPERRPRLAFDLARLNSASRRIEPPAGSATTGARALDTPLPSGGLVPASSPIASTPHAPVLQIGSHQADGTPARSGTTASTIPSNGPSTPRFLLRSQPAGTGSGAAAITRSRAAVGLPSVQWTPPPETAVPVAPVLEPTQARPGAAPETAQTPTEAPDAGELADALAALLDLEADLRGIAR